MGVGDGVGVAVGDLPVVGPDDPGEVGSPGTGWQPASSAAASSTQPARRVARRGLGMPVRLARAVPGRHTGRVIDLTAGPLEVAPRLLGCLLRQDEVVIRLTEVEAYDGTDDLAAHAARGPRPHTRDLFADPGTLYCYRSHGLHICGNLVCGPAGHGSAVLLRAGEVVAGLDTARARRPGVADVALARGPGNLGRVMGWTLADSGGHLGRDGLELAELPPLPAAAIASGPRTGVSVAHQRPWRFWVAGDPTVSAYRLSPRAVADHRAW